MQSAETTLKPNQKTNQVLVGSVPLGGGAPCAVQSMLNLPLNQVEENLQQINRVAEAGCDIIRIAIPHTSDLDYFEEICAKSPLPVVADIHFDAAIAIEAAKRGAAKLRINPGNIGGLEATIPVLEAAKQAGIPVRIGVNAGSLDKKLQENTSLTLPQKLAQSAKDYVEFCQQQGFTNLVVSAKAHDVPTTVETYRIISQEMPHIPLHIGVTEAGTLFQGLIKSASGLGILLEEGIGDTMRISLTDDPVEEVKAAWVLLGALGLRLRYPELISCPTCGRCKVDLISLAKQVESRLQSVSRPLRVAVMGCVVNGPGEAKDADIGVACGSGQGAIFVGGHVIKKVPENEIVDQLMEEIGKL
jgi:(E)-4-hydroxy-3-methylbut-2-enyl-diphosphate synthase